MASHKNECPVKVKRQCQATKKSSFFVRRSVLSAHSFEVVAVILPTMVLTSVKRPFSSVRPQLVVLAFIFMVAFVFLLSHNVKDQKSWSTGMLVQAMHAVKLPESSTEEEERHRYNLVDPQDLVRMRFNMMDCTTGITIFISDS